MIEIVNNELFVCSLRNISYPLVFFLVSLGKLKHSLVPAYEKLISKLQLPSLGQKTSTCNYLFLAKKTSTFNDKNIADCWLNYRIFILKFQIPTPEALSAQVIQIEPVIKGSIHSFLTD